MISRKTAFFWVITLSLITGIVTFSMTNIISFSIGEKVVISKQKYEHFQYLNNNFDKMLGLKAFIEENYYQPVDDVNFEDGIIKGLFKALDDPYSVYMSKDEFDSFMTHTKGTYGGIGVIMTPGEDGFITVVSPIEDTPGERAGIQPEDKIIKVNDEEVIAEKLDEAVAMIKGEPGTKVTLTIIRPGKADPFSVEITREEIRLNTVKSRVLKDKIGYIRITMFDEQTS
ncbi:MAG: PDZ domain-containing protein, partial [Alkaliphilus sp.]|nr:PDZ domain-containing protein [Alkaliphilus sp.]